MRKVSSWWNVDYTDILPSLSFSFATTFANIMCSQPLPPPLSLPFAMLMIMALEECGYQSRRGIRVPKNGGIESCELMIDLQSIRDSESINF
nr:hypothetical protein [Tanacetum cinerariifolium]